MGIDASRYQESWRKANEDTWFDASRFLVGSTVSKARRPQERAESIAGRNAERGAKARTPPAQIQSDFNACNSKMQSAQKDFIDDHAKIDKAESDALRKMGFDPDKMRFSETRSSSQPNLSQSR